MTLSGHCRADCPCRGVTSGSTNRAEAFDELRAVDEWRMKAEVNAEAADRLGRMLEAAEAERDALRRQLLDETYRPEGGEIVMRELSRVKAERDEWRAGMERLRVENDHLLHPSMGETVTMRSRLTTLSEVLAGVKAERDALSARLQTVRDWATADHGGVKRPIDIWPGLAAALAPLDASLGTPGDEAAKEADWFRETPASLAALEQERAEVVAKEARWGGLLTNPDGSVSPVGSSGSAPGDEKPQASEPESKQWWAGGAPGELASYANEVIHWVNINGGEARYEMTPDLTAADPYHGCAPMPRIAIRTDAGLGWFWAKPGDRIVKGDGWFQNPDRTSNAANQLRRFTVLPSGSSGSAE